MQILVNRVYRTDSPEHKPIEVKRWLYLDDIDSLEEDFTNKALTKVIIKTGEEFFISEDIGTIKDRYETIKEEMINEQRTRNIIGGE